MDFSFVVLIIVLGYIPVIYKLNKRVFELEEKVRELKKF